MHDPETTFDQLKRSLEQAATHARGEDVPGLVEHAPDGFRDDPGDTTASPETNDDTGRPSR